MGLTILPPLVINTTLGFLLFTSHSFFALTLARLPFFRHPHETPHATTASLDHGGEIDPQDDEESINIHTLLSGPTIIPRHPTLLSALSGAGAGLVQGVAFTPVENVVRLIQQSATSLTSFLVRALRLPLPNIPSVEPIPSSPYQAVKNFLSSERWRKSPSWWTGWRWTAGRDASVLLLSLFRARRDDELILQIELFSLLRWVRYYPTSWTPRQGILRWTHLGRIQQCILILLFRRNDPQRNTYDSSRRTGNYDRSGGSDRFARCGGGRSTI